MGERVARNGRADCQRLCEKSGNFPSSLSFPSHLTLDSLSLFTEMSSKSTPPRFANDLTNLNPSSSSSSRPTLKTTSRTSYRQTSLADSFFRSSSPLQTPQPVSTPASSIFESQQPDATVASSPCCSKDVEMEIDGNGEGYDEAEQIEPPSSKRRRTTSTSSERDQEEFVWQEADLVANFKGDASTVRKRMESAYNKPGQQMSMFKAVQRRELGFRAGAAQSESHFLYHSSIFYRMLTRTGLLVSMRPHLQTLVSSNEDHVARIPSLQSHRDFAPPFALAYSNRALLAYLDRRIEYLLTLMTR